MTPRKQRVRDPQPRRAEDRDRRGEDRQRHRLGMALVALGALLVLGNLVWSWGTSQQSSHAASQAGALARRSDRQADQIRQLVAGENASRVENVNTWCSALNAQARVLRAFVARFPGVPALPLPDLDCTALVARTQAAQAPSPTPRPLAGLTHPCTAGDFYMQCAAAAPNVLKLAPPVGVSVLAHGVDFAWGAPSVGQMRAWGASFGASYYSYDLSKNWTAAAVSAYHRAGIATVGVWETAADRALADYAAGRADASAAARQAASVGEPASRPIYFAVDFDTTFYGCRICAYFRGVRSVLGSRTGAYGGIATMRTLFGQGLIGYGWQTSAWSSGQWDPRAQLQQYAYTNTVDFDRATARDYGQWPYATPAPARHPSRAQLRARWRRERARTLAAYHRAGCTAHSRSRTCVRLRAREHALYLDLRR